MTLFLFLLIYQSLYLLWHESASFFSCLCFLDSSASFFVVMFGSISSHSKYFFSPTLVHDLVLWSHCSCGSFMSICSIKFCLACS